MTQKTASSFTICHMFALEIYYFPVLLSVHALLARLLKRNKCKAVSGSRVTLPVNFACKPGLSFNLLARVTLAVGLPYLLVNRALDSLWNRSTKRNLKMAYVDIVTVNKKNCDEITIILYSTVELLGQTIKLLFGSHNCTFDEWTFVHKELNGLVQEGLKWLFSGKIFFPSEVPEFLHVLFN